jgi:hypothetical protein
MECGPKDGTQSEEFRRRLARTARLLGGRIGQSMAIRADKSNREESMRCCCEVSPLVRSRRLI